ncbi:MAG: ThiF family adenylyltransferase, partial [Gammaproteobacteria bacterium]|nr:ThiF family adenylyltransferase [Gammaproteobacteria bacterium]
PARATGFPLLGLTLGTDGSWSARFWPWDGKKFSRIWCDKVRVAGKRLDITFNDKALPAPRRRETLKHTIDTWGIECQNKIARLRICIVGVGSVGSMIAESLARMGIQQLVLVDPDKIEEHNLDRLLYANASEVGQYKVEVAARRLRRISTAEHFEVRTHPLSIQSESVLSSTLDCDLIFSAVDRPLPKDLINRIAYAHCIPVVSGGVFVDNKNDGSLGQAAWSVTTVGPGRRCLRCDGQYTSSDVVIERDGSLDNPSYIAESLRDSEPTNQNVFPFCANLASFMVLEMVRLTMAADWWPDTGGKLHYSMIPGRLQHEQAACQPNCSIRESEALGDEYRFPFIEGVPQVPQNPSHAGLSESMRLSRKLLING